jgi:serine/threonine protein kinase
MPEPSPPVGPLLAAAAAAIAPAVAGCARTLRPSPEKTPASPTLVPKAIDLFGPRIVPAWRTQMDSRGAIEQQETVRELAMLSPAAAREQAASALARLATNASPEDRALASDYLAALPRSAQRTLIPDVGATGWRLPPLLLPLTERTLAGLLPFHVPPFPIGSEVPGTAYRLEELMGTSRSGVLYRALNAAEYGGGPVAVKICLDPARATALRERRDVFERLRTLSGKTWSPRLLRIQSQAVEARPPFLVYDHGPGMDLTLYLATGRVSLDRGLSPARTYDLIRQLATGLVVLHGRGVVHGDLKPSAVLVHEDKIVLSDVGFGDAVRHALAPSSPAAAPANGAAEGVDLAAQASLFHGSYSELYRTNDPAKPGKSDPRSDMYALGVLWYQLLLGDFALQLDAAAVGGLAEPPFSLPRGQVALIAQCVGDFADRPAGAHELLNLMRPSVAVILNLAHSGAPIVAPPARGPTGGLRQLEERLARRQQPAEPPPLTRPPSVFLTAAAPAPDPTVTQLERLRQTLADQIERDALYEARATADVLLRMAPRDQDVLDTIAFLDEQLQSIPGNPLEEVRVLTGHRDWVNSLVFAPDSRRLLSGAGGTPTGGEWGESEDRSMRLWDVESGRELKNYAGHSSSVTALAFTPDGRRFLSGSRSGTVALWDIDTGRPLRRFDRRVKLVWALAVSPDGRYTLSGSDDKAVRLWNTDTGARIRRLEAHSKGVPGVAFTPDGRRAVSGSYDGSIRLWDIQNGNVLATIQGHMQAVLAVAVTSDNRQIVSGGIDNLVRLWDLNDGRPVRQFVGHGAQVNSVAVSPDGRWIVSGGSDHTVRVWDLRKGQERARSTAHAGTVTTVAVSPDGQYAASASRDTTVRLFRLPK